MQAAHPAKRKIQIKILPSSVDACKFAVRASGNNV